MPTTPKTIHCLVKDCCIASLHAHFVSTRSATHLGTHAQAANCRVQVRLQELIKVDKKKKVEITVNEIATGHISLHPFLTGVMEFESEIVVVSPSSCPLQSSKIASLTGTDCFALVDPIDRRTTRGRNHANHNHSEGRFDTPVNE